MYEVLWAHIDIVVVAVKSLSSSVGASPSYQPYEGGISPTLPYLQVCAAYMLPNG